MLQMLSDLAPLRANVSSVGCVTVVRTVVFSLLTKCQFAFFTQMFAQESDESVLGFSLAEDEGHSDQTRCVCRRDSPLAGVGR